MFKLWIYEEIDMTYRTFLGNKSTIWNLFWLFGAGILTRLIQYRLTFHYRALLQYHIYWNDVRMRS